ncbi:DUF427 domain-containing protein [Mycobacterium sp. BMJ-28]
MSLYAGRGPLGRDPAGWAHPPLPDGAVFIEPHPRRVQALVNGRSVIDTENALLVHRRDQPLRYAFPAAEVAGLPTEAVPEHPDYVHVPWDGVDTWLEEGRTLVHYPPNPYHRVDCRPGHRGLRVSVAGTVLVDTTDTVALFETALAPRLYVDPALVHTELLARSATTSYCNYKGYATYWSAHIDEVTVADIAWSYDDPLPESTPIRGMLSFDETRTEVLAELPAGSAADCGCHA